MIVGIDIECTPDKHNFFEGKSEPSIKRMKSGNTHTHRQRERERERERERVAMKSANFATEPMS